jgi:glycosyltransferase involved in cell wall biosynthesis
MKERSQFQLDVFGSSRDKFGSLRALAAASGVGDCVRFHGFASDDALDSALDDCDAGINLRYPSKGESSLSQLRLWSHAVPTIVTREAWYAELGDDVVTYVRPDHEIDDLRAALRSLLASPEGFAEKGRRGLERLETVHSPEHYAQSFVNLAESLPTPGTATETA